MNRNKNNSFNNKRDGKEGAILLYWGKLKDMKLKKLRISTKSLLLILGFVCLVLIISGWFYWYEWRPSSVRKSCLSEAIEVLRNDSDFSISGFNSLYRVCLAKHGVRPESIFIEKSENQTLQE